MKINLTWNKRCTGSDRGGFEDLPPLGYPQFATLPHHPCRLTLVPQWVDVTVATTTLRGVLGLERLTTGRDKTELGFFDFYERYVDDHPTPLQIDPGRVGKRCHMREVRAAPTYMFNVVCQY
ncbi:hypothetical protein J6590_007102 [Homalodisca vitripennis]|nr:hypothetical protein J6590_007102 [Homalodisca vitripennis]